MTHADQRADGEGESKQWEDDFFGEEDVSTLQRLPLANIP